MHGHWLEKFSISQNSQYLDADQFQGILYSLITGSPSVIWPVLRMGTGSVESVKNTKQYPFVVLRLLFHVKRTKTGYFVLLRLNFHVKRTKEGHFVLLKHHFR